MNSPVKPVASRATTNPLSLDTLLLDNSEAFCKDYSTSEISYNDCDLDYILKNTALANNDKSLSFHQSYLLGNDNIDNTEVSATEIGNKLISEYLSTVEPRKKSQAMTALSSSLTASMTSSKSFDDNNSMMNEKEQTPKKRLSGLMITRRSSKTSEKKAAEQQAAGILVPTNKPDRQVDARKVRKIPLIPVNCSFGIVTEKRHDVISFEEMVRKEKVRLGSRNAVTVVFAVRRPGCGACREHALQLKQLAAQENVCCVGVIKHINVDNDALLEFYQEYFKFPIYVDEKWQTYKALGSRKIPLWKLLPKAIVMEARYKKKNIRNVPFGGDIFTQGGILVFDKDANLRYVYYETYAQILDLDVLRKAIEDARTPLPSSP